MERVENHGDTRRASVRCECVEINEAGCDFGGQQGSEMILGFIYLDTFTSHRLEPPGGSVSGILCVGLA
jgi:hypothetical protein